MGEWPTVALEALASDEKSAISKPYGSAILKSDYRDHGIPVVRGVNLARGVFYDDDFVYISEETAGKMPGAEMVSGDLVVTHRGTVGQVSMIPRKSRFPRYVASTSHVKVRLDPARAMPEFYYYWFASPIGQHTIQSHVSVVGVPGLAQPVATVKSFPVPKPPLRDQHAIVDILSSLDNKIACNERVGTVALQLVDSYFQEFDRRSVLETVRYGDIANIGGGGTPKTAIDEFWGGGTAWATPTDVTGLASPYLSTTSRTISESGLASISSPLYPKGSILMTSRATIGAFAVALTQLAVNQGFIVVNAKDRRFQWWLFHEMRSRVDEYISYANGATFLELSKGKFKALSLGVPAAEVATEFGSIAEGVHGAAASVLAESAEIVRVRDTLLPLLMSGKIDVKAAESLVEEVV